MSNEQLTNQQIELIQQQVVEIMEELDPTKGRLIQIKQGPRTALAVDSLMIGEPCYLTDDKIFVIGTGNGYIEFPNIESLSELEVTDGSITYENLNQALKDRILELESSKVTVNNTLTSDSIEEALSAKQGKELNSKIQSIIDNSNEVIINNTLTSDSIEEALSAKQGKVLDEKIKNLQDNAVTVNVVDNLTSTSTNDPLSANQGRVLNDRIDEVIANNDITVVNDTLISTSTTEALSANQGRLLNETKASKDKATISVDGLMSKEDKVKLNGIDTEANKTIINNTLTSTSTTEALSANQGKILNDRIDDVIANNDITIVTDNLTSDSATEALSAKQGKVLDGKITSLASSKADKTTATTTVDGLLSSADKVKLDGIATGANKTVINNTLTSTSTTEALSANQGKVLNDTKASKDVVTITVNGLMSSTDKIKLNGIDEGANKTTIVDNLTSTSSTNALSANQGKILNDRIDDVIANNDITIVTDNLNSTSTTEALSANQGKILNDTKASKDVATTTVNGLMSATDKVKLNGVETGANKTVYVNNLTSTSITEALTANQGKVLNDKINTLTSDKADKSKVTTTTDGLMSKEDKVKLDGVETGANKTVIVDNLSSTSAVQGLSANQGRLLNARIDDVIANNDITIVTDNLTSDSSTEALSAKQGKLLNDKIQNHIDNDVVLNVIDNLDSTSSADVLSANQGRLLNNNKADKTLATTSANGLMSSSDKSKLNGIETGANKTVVTDNLTTTSTTNALSANQGKVLNDKIQNLIDNPVSTTINNTLTSTSTTEALSANQGKVLNDNQNTHASKRASKTELGHVNAWEQGVNIPTSAWQGASAPYTASISLADIKSTDNPLITPIYNIDFAIALNQRDNYAKIDEVTTSNGTINFRCLEEKPDIQLSLLVKVVSS